MIWSILFLIGVATILPLRIAQLNTTTSDTFNIIYAVVTILIILCFLIPLWVKKIQIKQNDSFKNKISGIIALVLSVLLIIDGFYNFVQYFTNFMQALKIDTTINFNFANFLIFLFEILTALFFMLYMFPYHFRLKKKPNYFTLAALFPVLWLAAHMLNVFLKSTTGISVSEHSFTILADAFSLLFFFSQARVLAKIELEKGHRGMLLYGYLSSLFLIISTVSDIIYTAKLFDAINKGKQITDYLVEGANQQITTPDKTLFILNISVSIVLCLYVLSVTFMKNFLTKNETYEYEYEGDIENEENKNEEENTDIDENDKKN
jgi:cell division protein FtsL